MTVKIEFTDDSHKCYTNIVEYRTDNGFFILVISNDVQDLTKIWPAASIKHAQVE